MRRVFLIDVLECPSCKGRMRVIAAIDQPKLIARILTHLGLPARAPPLAPARFEPRGSPSGDLDLDADFAPAAEHDVDRGLGPDPDPPDLSDVG
jgi:uncharacterized protein YbaR (Trm112 family)